MAKLGSGLTELLNIGAKGAIHIGLLGRGIGASLSPITRPPWTPAPAQIDV